MEMKRNEIHLPPLWVKGFSFVSLIFLVVPLFPILKIVGADSRHFVSAFGLRLESGEDPMLWILSLDAVLFMAALTGLFILSKRSFAYRFGILYCFVAIGVTIPAHLFVGDWDGDAWWNICVQYSLLGCFMIHLFRYRDAWSHPSARGGRLETASPSPEPDVARSK